MNKTRDFIPEVINGFNVYKNDDRLIGVTDEISLAEFAAMTETVNGPGILGEYETVIIGHFGSMEQEIKFRVLDDDSFAFSNPMEVQQITLRASRQGSSRMNGNIVTSPIRIVFRGRQKSFSPGSLKQGAQMGASVKLEVLYVLIEINGESKLELDKLNNVYMVNGVDLLAEIKAQC